MGPHGLPVAHLHPLQHLLLDCQVTFIVFQFEIQMTLFRGRFGGISYMKDKPAYECRTAMFIYNVFQTFFSLWIFSRLGGFWLTGKYRYTTQCCPNV